MSLSINQNKINEQLAKNHPGYVVFPCNLEVEQISFPDSSSIVASTEDVSRDWGKYRDRVLFLRQRLVEKGKQPANSPEELERIIDETRGRS